MPENESNKGESAEERYFNELLKECRNENFDEDNFSGMVRDIYEVAHKLRKQWNKHASDLRTRLTEEESCTNHLFPRVYDNPNDHQPTVTLGFPSRENSSIRMDVVVNHTGWEFVIFGESGHEIGHIELVTANFDDPREWIHYSTGNKRVLVERLDSSEDLDIVVEKITEISSKISKMFPFNA
jgi:hypothetical protein